MIPLLAESTWSWDGFMANLGWNLIMFVLGGLFGRLIFKWAKTGLNKALND